MSGIWSDRSVIFNFVWSGVCLRFMRHNRENESPSIQELSKFRPNFGWGFSAMIKNSFSADTMTFNQVGVLLCRIFELLLSNEERRLEELWSCLNNNCPARIWLWNGYYDSADVVFWCSFIVCMFKSFSL